MLKFMCAMTKWSTQHICCICTYIKKYSHRDFTESMVLNISSIYNIFNNELFFSRKVNDYLYTFTTTLVKYQIHKYILFIL